MSAPVPNTNRLDRRPRSEADSARPGMSVGQINAGAFGKPAESDKRTTALQGAITILRSRPQVKAEEVVAMAEKFHEFLKKGDGPTGFGV